MFAPETEWFGRVDVAFICRACKRAGAGIRWGMQSKTPEDFVLAGRCLYLRVIAFLVQLTHLVRGGYSDRGRRFFIYLKHALFRAVHGGGLGACLHAASCVMINIVAGEAWGHAFHCMYSDIHGVIIFRDAS